MKAKIDNTQQNNKGRLCRDRDETINHIISECSKLTRREAQDYSRLGGEGYPLGIVQEIIIWLNYQIARGIGLPMNANKTEYMCFKRKEAFSTQNGVPPKLVNKFIYPRSSVSSTESDVNMRLAKGMTVIDRLSIIWKSEPYDK